MPERIQRKRTKGWKMPPNSVSVTRPGRHANPFRVERLGGPRSERGEEWIVVDTRTHAWAFPYTFASKAVATQHAIACWRSELTDDRCAEIKRDLEGQNLACFCALDQPCHADVLLEIANSPLCDHQERPIHLTGGQRSGLSAAKLQARND